MNFKFLDNSSKQFILFDPIYLLIKYVLKSNILRLEMYSRDLDNTSSPKSLRLLDSTFHSLFSYYTYPNIVLAN